MITQIPLQFIVLCVKLVKYFLVELTVMMHIAVASS